MASEDHTLWVGNLDHQVTESLLMELFMQTGPVSSVKRPKEKGGIGYKSFAFIDFEHPESVAFTMNTMTGVSLFGRQLKLQTRSGGGIGSIPGTPKPSTPQVERRERFATPILSRVSSSPATLQQQWNTPQNNWQQQQYGQPLQYAQQQQYQQQSPQPLLQAGQQPGQAWSWQLSPGAWLQQGASPQQRDTEEQRRRLQRHTERVGQHERHRRDQNSSHRYDPTAGGKDRDYRSGNRYDRQHR